MLSTSDPGGGSCRAMLSDVSMVKYTSMGHSSLTGESKHTHTHKRAHLTHQRKTLWLWNCKDSASLHPPMHGVSWLWATAPKRRQRAATSKPSIFRFSCLMGKYEWGDAFLFFKRIFQRQVDIGYLKFKRHKTQQNDRTRSNTQQC